MRILDSVGLWINVAKALRDLMVNEAPCTDIGVGDNIDSEELS